MIIWDEAPISDRRCFEFLDRTLKDVLEDDEHLFGGMSIPLRVTSEKYFLFSQKVENHR